MAKVLDIPEGRNKCETQDEGIGAGGEEKMPGIE